MHEYENRGPCLFSDGKVARINILTFDSPQHFTGDIGALFLQIFVAKLGG